MSALPRGAPLAYDDPQRMPDHGHRSELVDGVLLVTPAPDLLVVPKGSAELRFVDRAPVLVVEVPSPSTRSVGLGTKRPAYEAAGVPAYWVVDPDEPTITAFHLAPGGYAEAGRAAGDEPFTTDRPFPVTVLPSRLLEDLGAHGPATDP